MSAAQAFEERAREALTRAGEIAAGAEASFRGAITGLNDAVDLAHAAGTMPQTVNRPVTARASLGDAARGYLALEIREWERAFLPGTWNSGSALGDLHERSLQTASAPISPEAVAEALTDAGIRLAQAEAILDGALGRLDDALEFALHAGFGSDEMQDLVNPGGHLGPIGSQFLKDAAVTDWDLDGYAYDGEEGEEIPGKFWDLHLLALAAKGEGDHLAAAAIWETALTRLPSGHSWRPRIDQTITSLRAVTHPGDIVTWDGRLIRSKASVHPAAPLTDLVHDHEAAVGAVQQPAALESAETTDRYAVARISKACRTLGEHPDSPEFEMPTGSAPSAAAVRRVQAASHQSDLSQSAVRTGQGDVPVTNLLAPPGHAVGGPARRPRAAKTAAPAEAPQKRGR